LIDHSGHILSLFTVFGSFALIAFLIRRKSLRFQHFAAVLALLPVFHSHLEPLAGAATPPPICCVLAQSIEPEVAFTLEERAVQFTLPIQEPPRISTAFRAGPRSIRSPPRWTRCPPRYLGCRIPFEPKAHLSRFS